MLNYSVRSADGWFLSGINPGVGVRAVLSATERWSLGFHPSKGYFTLRNNGTGLYLSSAPAPA